MKNAKDQSVVPADASCGGPSLHLGSKLDRKIFSPKHQNPY